MIRRAVWWVMVCVVLLLAWAIGLVGLEGFYPWEETE